MIPPTFKGIDDKITCFIRASHVHVYLARVFIHNSARGIAALRRKVVIKGFNLILATTQAAPGEFAYFDSRFAIYAYSNNVFIGVFGI
jgi:hypothetical protein